MATTKDIEHPDTVSEVSNKTCFIIMPISDTDGYDPGHFKRVYEYIIKPACAEAGFIPLRADDVQRTNNIVIDIIKNILESDMALCDLSSRNANVFYELGIRQSFDKPVTLIKDRKTPRVFDIQGFKDVEYDNNLRVDEVKRAINEIADNLRNTYEMKGKDVNSIVELLGIQTAKVKATEISPETDLVLNAISDISNRISKLETDGSRQDMNIGYTTGSYSSKEGKVRFFETKDGRFAEEGDWIEHPKFGKGEIEKIDFSNGQKKALISFVNHGSKIMNLEIAGKMLLLINSKD